MPAALLPLLSRLLTSLIGQIFIALGISAVTYKGVEKLQAYFVRMMQDEMGRFPSEALLMTRDDLKNRPLYVDGIPELKIPTQPIPDGEDMTT